MNFKLVILSVLALTLASTGFAQPFVACIMNDCFQLREDGTGNPLPDGTPCVIYYDANGNGPDAADLPAVVCTDPPLCEDGPPGTVNFNTFTLNAGVWGFDPGEFLADPCFTSSGFTPEPARYYIVVNTPHGGKWTSNVFNLIVGPQDVDLCEWTWTSLMLCCLPIPASREVVFSPPIGPQHEEACITLCEEAPLCMVTFGPLGTDPHHAAELVPFVSLVPDCQCACQVASGYIFNGDPSGPWVLVPRNGEYYFQQQIGLGNGTEGCIRVVLDFMLPVQMGEVAILPLDNSVSVKFSTASETNLSRFEIRRDGNELVRLAATNSPTGHDYSYMDRSAVNGTTYRYEIVAVSANGSSNVVAEQSVTPSIEHAVVTEYALHQNYPNPFNPTTSIRFDLLEKNLVTLKVFDIVGREVKTLVNGERAAGVNVVSFDATNLTSGLYFYTLKVGNIYSDTKKMLLVK